MKGRRTRGPALVLLGALAASACGPGSEEPETTVDRSAFVAAYVDLRVAALRTEGVLDPERRRAVLAAHGVTEEELLEFAEVHGRDAPFMRDVWSEVEQKLDSARIAANPPEPGEPGDTGRIEGDPGAMPRAR